MERAKGVLWRRRPRTAAAAHPSRTHLADSALPAPTVCGAPCAGRPRRSCAMVKRLPRPTSRRIGSTFVSHGRSDSPSKAEIGRGVRPAVVRAPSADARSAAPTTRRTGRRVVVPIPEQQPHGRRPHRWGVTSPPASAGRSSRLSRAHRRPSAATRTAVATTLCCSGSSTSVTTEAVMAKRSVAAQHDSACDTSMPNAARCRSSH